MNPIERFAALSPEAQGRAIACLSPDQQRKVIEGLRQVQQIESRTKFYRMFPERGPLRRELYHHHMQFFRDGYWAQYRAFIGGNGTGKTEGGGFETVCHLSGLYPEWWEGYDFGRCITAWVGGDTANTLRDIIQVKLFGTNDYRDKKWGTGIIPADIIGKPNPSNRLVGLIDFVPIKHKSGRWSTLFLKSYEQDRKAWQGSDVHWVWLDEQSPTHIYEESLTRFRGEAKDGRLILTFTGLEGATDVVLKFLPELNPEEDDESMRAVSRSRVVCPMDDVPHLTPEAVAQYLAQYSGQVRETRRTGIPYAGAGRVYIVDEAAFVVEPFKIPAHWALIAGADVGYGSGDGDTLDQGGTAAVWAAVDRENETVYVFDEYFRSQAEAPVHAAAMKKHGDWVPIECDYAGVIITEEGRSKVISGYRRLGLTNIGPAQKDVEAGIREVEVLLSQSKLKVFRTCSGLINEYRMYTRKEGGKIIKKNDHRLDALRYLVMGRKRAKTKPIPRTVQRGSGSVNFGFYQ